MSEYITPKEAVALSKQNTVDEICTSRNIYDLYLQSNKQETNSDWLLLTALAAVYNAGRVAGIRQEREKRNKKAVRV